MADYDDVASALAAHGLHPVRVATGGADWAVDAVWRILRDATSDAELYLAHDGWPEFLSWCVVWRRLGDSGAWEFQIVAECDTLADALRTLTHTPGAPSPTAPWDGQ